MRANFVPRNGLAWLAILADAAVIARVAHDGLPFKKRVSRARGLDCVANFVPEPGRETTDMPVRLRDITLKDHRALDHPPRSDDSHPCLHGVKFLLAKNFGC